MDMKKQFIEALAKQGCGREMALEILELGERAAEAGTQAMLSTLQNSTGLAAGLSASYLAVQLMMTKCAHIKERLDDDVARKGGEIVSIEVHGDITLN